MDHRTLVTDELWDRIAPRLPGKTSDPGRTGADNRQFLEAVLYVARTGIPWRDLPRDFGEWNSVYQRFARWEKRGVWEQIFGELSKGGEFSDVLIDSTSIKAHQHAAGAQKNRAIKLLADLAEALQQSSTS